MPRSGKGAKVAHNRNKNSNKMKNKANGTTTRSRSVVTQNDSSVIPVKQKKLTNVETHLNEIADKNNNATVLKRKKALSHVQKQKLLNQQDRTELNACDGIDVFVDPADSVDPGADLDYDDDIDDDTGVVNQNTEESDLALGATGVTVTEEEQLMQNPALKKLFNKLLDERIRDAERGGESSGSTLISNLTPGKGADKRTKQYDNNRQ